MLRRAPLAHPGPLPRAEWTVKACQPGPRKRCYWTGLEFQPQGIKLAKFTSLSRNFTFHSNPKTAVLAHFGRADKICSLMPCPRSQWASSWAHCLYLNNLLPPESWGVGHGHSALKSLGKHSALAGLQGDLQVTQQKLPAHIYCLLCADVGGG